MEYMDKKICDEKHKSIDKELELHTTRLNKHSDKLDVIELDILAQKKDTTHLQDAIKSLQKSIDILIVEISNLKIKPLAKYEKAAWIIATAIITYVMSKVLGV